MQVLSCLNRNRQISKGLEGDLARCSEGLWLILILFSGPLQLRHQSTDLLSTSSFIACLVIPIPIRLEIRTFFFFSPGTLGFLCTSNKWILNILQGEWHVERLHLDFLLKNQASPFLSIHTHLSWIFIAGLKALKKSKHSDILTYYFPPVDNPWHLKCHYFIFETELSQETLYVVFIMQYISCSSTNSRNQASRLAPGEQTNLKGTFTAILQVRRSMQMGPILLLTNCWIVGNVYINILNKYILPVILDHILFVLPFKNLDNSALNWNGFNKSGPGVL